MIKISRSSGDIEQLARSLHDLSSGLLPYAAATAMTKTAKEAQKAVVEQMKTSFDRPTAYTLNSLFVVPATKNRLIARIGIKNQGGAGVSPENFLFPEVAGGARKNKRFEVALRNAGFLKPGQFALPGSGTKLDASGNVSGATARSLLTSLSGLRATSGKKLKNSLFVGRPQGGNRPDGIWRREGKRLRALFIFTDQSPQYRQRLNFNGVVAQVVRARFTEEFFKAAAALKEKDRQ